MWPFNRTATHEVQPPVSNSDQQARLLEISSSSQTPAQQLPHASSGTEKVQWTGFSGERLGLPGYVRIPLIMCVSAACGFSLGAAKGGPTAADRYRAENAHRLPQSRSGWYLYHKSKNYHLLVGSGKEGFKFGFVLMGWATLFGVTEEMVDRSRARLFARREEDEEQISGQRDVLSTVMAALTVAGAYSWKRGFDKFAAARMSKMALRYSLMYGLAQDALASLRGDQPAYVTWITRRAFRNSDKSETI